MLTEIELKRYKRQILIDEIGKSGQEKLKKATILLAGVGGLGSVIASYLCAAGIGMMKIIDSDKVELSNLNRQILHWNKNIKEKKVISAREKLTNLNPDIKIEAIHKKITEKNVFDLADGVDLIIDGMDNLETRFHLNKAAIKFQIPFFHGAISGFEGRVMTILPGKSACLACLHEKSTPQKEIPVIGTTAAITGGIQATEVIKYITGVGTLLTDRLLSFDGITMKFLEFKLKRNPDCKQCRGIKI